MGGWETPSPQKVRQMLSPEKGPQENAPPSNISVPVATLAARSSDAKGRLIETELRQKFGEEVRWHKKQADHLTVELETARAKRKELEADFAKTKADLEHQLKEALAENEDLLAAGGGQRGPRAELEASRKEVEGLKKEVQVLLARLTGGGEARRIHVGELRDARDRLSAAQAEAQALREALKQSQAQATQAAETMAKAVERAEKAEREAGGSRSELAAQMAALEVQAGEAANEAAQASSHAERAERDAANAKAELKATVEALEARVYHIEGEADRARQHADEARAHAAEARAGRGAAMQEAQAIKEQMRELHAQRAVEKEQRAAAQLLADQAEDEAKKAQAQASKQRSRADGLAARLALVEGSQEGAKAAASVSQALSKCQRELMELQGEYNRAVYDMAKAKAERSEMAGKVTKSKAEATTMSQRLAAAHLALAEVVHVIQLSSGDGSGGEKMDQDTSAKHKGSSAMARSQLYQVRKIIEQADEQRRATELVQT